VIELDENDFPPLEPQPFVTAEGREITRLRADLATHTAERDALAAEVAALKPQSNADEFASIPIRSWVIEVFQHLCHSPHTPDQWKRDLDNKTIALLDAIEQWKKGER
jgi:hypothetical protein